MEMISKIKIKEQEPSVYALCFNQSNCRKLTQVIAYSLEEAIDLGLSSLKITGSLMPEMFVTMSMKELRDQVLVGTLSVNPLNELMQKIVDKKDHKLLAKSESKFTQEEFLYLQKKILP